MTVTSLPELTSQTWTWRGWRINYIQQGTQGPCLLLVHGFGASTAHWRKNMEELSQAYRIWAIDLLGFGRSEKPRQIYTGELWRDQMQAFCQEVIGEPVYVAGNSLGGYAALCLAVDCPDWVRGLILINCAGPFSDENPQPQSSWQTQLAAIQQQVFKLPFVIQLSSFVLFSYIRQRSMIRKILLQVYKDPTAVTDRLVEEIYLPSCDPGALGVFAAVFKSPPGRKLDDLLHNLTRPLLLLWGTADPWMPASKTEKFQAHYPQAKLVLVDAGHCPHDECPKEVDQAIDSWIQDQQ